MLNYYQNYVTSDRPLNFMPSRSEQTESKNRVVKDPFSLAATEYSSIEKCRDTTK